MKKTSEPSLLFQSWESNLSDALCSIPAPKHRLSETVDTAILAAAKQQLKSRRQQKKIRLFVLFGSAAAAMFLLVPMFFATPQAISPSNCDELLDSVIPADWDWKNVSADALADPVTLVWEDLTLTAALD